MSSEKEPINIKTDEEAAVLQNPQCQKIEIYEGNVKTCEIIVEPDECPTTSAAAAKKCRQKDANAASSADAAVPPPPKKKRKRLPGLFEPAAYRKSGCGGKLSAFHKEYIFRRFMDKGCSAKEVETAVGKYPVELEPTLEYYNQHIEEARANVHEECDSLSFSNIEKWLKVFKSWQLPKHCFFEEGVVLNLIANTEPQPKKEKVGGVNFKSIYKFLGNALLGHPQLELSAIDSEFLSREFELLINEANTPAADKETRALKTRLQNLRKDCDGIKREKLSLDPLLMEENIKVSNANPWKN